MPEASIFGIRHHGPGSARSLRRALEELQPDVILVEGPPDAAGVLPLLTHAEMQPPVALLVYVPEEPKRAVYYPFAVFSPEWQALHYGLTRGVEVRFMDLPMAHRLAMQREETPTEELPSQDSAPETQDPTPEAQHPTLTPPNGGPQHPTPEEDVRDDPLGLLAEAAGYSDGERWWDHLVEQR